LPVRAPRCALAAASPRTASTLSVTTSVIAA
jgi:hypothetical protein